MRRSLVVIAVAVCLWVAGPANAFFGTGLFPFGGFSGLNRGGSSCGEPCASPLPTIAYVGWNDDPNGVAWGGEPSAPLYNLTRIAQQHRVRGCWLGVTQPINLSENITILGSGWYLFPQSADATESVAADNSAYRRWSVKDQWWFVDGLAAFGASYSGGFALLAGLRYDYFYSEFSDPVSVGVASTPEDEATATCEAIIPLIGAQLAHNSPLTSLAVRFVGFPTVAGKMTYAETAGGFSARGSGNYQGGYFLEFLSEASRQVGGAKIGAFVRWNAFHGKIPSLNLVNAGGIVEDFDFSVDRHSWTVGGTVSVAFQIPGLI